MRIFRDLQGGWSKEHDRQLWKLMTMHQNSSEKAQETSATQIADSMNKSKREVQLRQRFLKRLHRDDQGFPVTPQLLSVYFKPTRRAACRMWYQALFDKALSAVSVSYCLWQVRIDHPCVRTIDNSMIRTEAVPEIPLRFYPFHLRF
jgi:hypothetical protein